MGWQAEAAKWALRKAIQHGKRGVGKSTNSYCRSPDNNHKHSMKRHTVEEPHKKGDAYRTATIMWCDLCGYSNHKII